MWVCEVGHKPSWAVCSAVTLAIKIHSHLVVYCLRCILALSHTEMGVHGGLKEQFQPKQKNKSKGKEKLDENLDFASRFKIQ